MIDMTSAHGRNRVTAPPAGYAYKRRMGWSFAWVSSLRSDFNYDYGVSVPAERQPASAGRPTPSRPQIHTPISGHIGDTFCSHAIPCQTKQKTPLTRAAKGAFGGVVGWFDIGVREEGPERGPDLE
jgi:predicted dithiol-disulfide oxidoreductase (DUF899 family)